MLWSFQNLFQVVKGIRKDKRHCGSITSCCCQVFLWSLRVCSCTLCRLHVLCFQLIVLAALAKRKIVTALETQGGQKAKNRDNTSRKKESWWKLSRPNKNIISEGKYKMRCSKCQHGGNPTYTFMQLVGTPLVLSSILAIHIAGRKWILQNLESCFWVRSSWSCMGNLKSARERPIYGGCISESFVK